MINSRTAEAFGHGMSAIYSTRNHASDLLVQAVAVGLLTLAATALASPAMAYVIELTTSIDLTDVADKAQLRRAVESAVEDVLANAISFSPTLITAQNARVVGDRMYSCC